MIFLILNPFLAAKAISAIIDDGGDQAKAKTLSAKKRREKAQKVAKARWIRGKEN